MYVKKGRYIVARIVVPCCSCGKPVTRRKSEVTKLATGRVFCSRACKRLVGCKPRTGTNVACEVCETEFYRPASSEQRYCSYACHNKAQTKPKVERVCEVCEKTFWVHESYARVQAARFCGRACMGQSNWKRPLGWFHNGKPALGNFFGYVVVWEPNHPSAPTGGWVFYHRLVMEKAIGRYLLPSEQVDHINTVKDDNRIDNLQILSHSEHSKKTVMDRRRRQEQIKRDLEELAEYRRRFGPLVDWMPIAA